MHVLVLLQDVVKEKSLSDELRLSCLYGCEDYFFTNLNEPFSVFIT